MKATMALAWLLGAAACSGQWYFEAGPWARGGMEVSVAGGSRAAAEGAGALESGRAHV